MSRKTPWSGCREEVELPELADELAANAARRGHDRRNRSATVVSCFAQGLLSRAGEKEEGAPRENPISWNLELNQTD